MDTLEDFMVTRNPTARRPLFGLTVLVVEDSRFACEAMRLLCLRSGARIRRADSLAHAHKHLTTYRPSILIVDIGLPDGSGLDLIASCHALTPRIDVILGTSGDAAVEMAVEAAGADGFIPKPISSLDAFQNAILKHLPAAKQPAGPRLLTDETVSPDILAYHDDLCHVASVIKGSDSATHLGYVTQFLKGIARSAQDAGLDNAASALARKHANGTTTKADVIALGALLQSRLAQAAPI